VAGGSKFGVAGNFGVNLVGGRTEVVFDRNTLLTATAGDIKRKDPMKNRISIPIFAPSI
jgi:hypothetical protein